jgi:hypothetical protein
MSKKNNEAGEEGEDTNAAQYLRQVKISRKESIGMKQNLPQ